MFIDKPRRVLLETEQWDLDVLIREDYWPRFKWLKETLDRVLTVTNVSFINDYLVQTGGWILNLATTTIGPIKTELSLFGLAILASSYLSFDIGGYRVVSGLGIPDSFPITFTEEYEIELIE
ncbi:hypothetical protein [Halosimplex halobium]|uniref:hypothetical protein n=1 Tax=Halosimplex halobium TaxID=3396618 RepID=UPI003F5586B3